jgi:flagellar FliL protein
MSKDAKPAAEGAEAPKKSKKLLIIILAVVLVLVLAGGGAAYMLLKKEPQDDDEAAEETAKPKKKDKKGEAAPSIFLNLETFTVNLIPETGDQYLQVIISLEIADATVEPLVKGQMPKIRNNIMLLLSSQKASQLQPKEGKEKLAADLLSEINAILEPPKKNKKGQVTETDGPVKSVLFTSFIIQ